MGSHSVVKMSSMSRHIKMVLRGAMPSVGVRLQSTSTMASSSQQHFQGSASSTRVSAEKKDFSTAVASSDTFDQEHWEALVSAASQHDSHKVPMAHAHGMDLVEAAACIHAYDKILLLVRHGEMAVSEDDGIDPLLSGKGVGQVLNLSRRTATFCNEETGLIPDLIVTSPLKRAMQTALMIFPQYSPAASLKNVPWICHGGLVERPSHNCDVPSSRQELESFFPGVDYSLYDGTTSESNTINGGGLGAMVESKLDLLDRTDDFLQWIKEREERIILVSSHSTWLQSFCGQTLHYDSKDSGSDAFKTGEMRAVGINFD